MKAFLISLLTFPVFTVITDAQVTPEKQLGNQAQVQTTPDFPPGSEKLFAESMKLVNPKHITWIKSTAKKVNEKTMTDEELKTEATSWAILGSMPEGDIEALCFLVLMQASKSAQEDLKAIMAKVKAINNAKAQQRKNLAEAQKAQAAASSKGSGETVGKIIPRDFSKNLSLADSLLRVFNPRLIKYAGPKTKADLDKLVETMKNDLDSMSEMGEMESLRLQMAMDRLSKMMSTLSNLLKKISDTAQAITQNMK